MSPRAPDDNWISSGIHYLLYVTAILSIKIEVDIEICVIIAIQIPSHPGGFDGGIQISLVIGNHLHSLGSRLLGDIPYTSWSG